jgi:hypothetical protein
MKHVLSGTGASSEVGSRLGTRGAPADAELIVDDSGLGFAWPEFIRVAGGWVSLRALGVPLPINVTPRARTLRRPRIRVRSAAAGVAGLVPPLTWPRLAELGAVVSRKVERGA